MQNKPRLTRNISGATAIEYAMIAALISIIAVAAFALVAAAFDATYFTLVGGMAPVVR